MFNLFKKKESKDTYTMTADSIAGLEDYYKEHKNEFSEFKAAMKPLRNEQGKSMNNTLIKYEMNCSIDKFEDIFPNGNPTTIRQYKDEDGNIVVKADTIKELFRLVAKIGDDTFTEHVCFGTFGFNEISLDDMTARQFIEDILIPYTKKMNCAIKRKYSN